MPGASRVFQVPRATRPRRPSCASGILSARDGCVIRIPGARCRALCGFRVARACRGRCVSCVNRTWDASPGRRDARVSRAPSRVLRYFREGGAPSRTSRVNRVRRASSRQAGLFRHKGACSRALCGSRKGSAPSRDVRVIHLSCAPSRRVSVSQKMGAPSRARSVVRTPCAPSRAPRVVRRCSARGVCRP